MRPVVAGLTALLLAGCQVVPPVAIGASGPRLVLPRQGVDSPADPTVRQSNSVVHVGEPATGTAAGAPVGGSLPGVAWGRGGSGGGTPGVPAVPLKPTPLDPAPVATPVPTGPFFPTTVAIADILAELATIAPPGADRSGRLTGEDGQVVQVFPDTIVAVPAGVTGTLTTDFPGAVPATLALGLGGVPVLHPRSTTVAGTPLGRALVLGQVWPATADVTVRFHAPGRREVPTTTTAADGTFKLEVPVDGTTRGVLVADEGGLGARLGAMPVTVTAGQPAIAPALSLVAPGTALSPLPPGPAGFYLAESTLAMSLAASPLPWRVPVTTVKGGRVAPYALPGATLVETFLGLRPDGGAGTLTGGTPGQAPPFLAAPDVSTMPATLVPGSALSWSAVPGATLYTVRLLAGDRPVPVWEGATPDTHLTVPATLSLPDEVLSLELTAWDAPDVTLYSVASARQLRVPAEPQGHGGRMSWATRVYVPTPIEPR